MSVRALSIDVAASREANPLADLSALGEKRLARPRPGVAYLAGLLLVTLLCLALPMLYAGFTLAVTVAWLWYLTHIHEHLPPGMYLLVLSYAVPGLVGALLAVFLVRPLFTLRTRQSKTFPLDPKFEPGFVAGINALCRAIGVSPPVEIRFTWDANASVHFRTPWLSLITGHKVLTIGMSLVGGLTAQQFVGVLAHEFGHFAQRFGMVCSFTVNRVNAWLEHCAYGEDAFVRKLRAWSVSLSGSKGGSRVIQLALWIGSKAIAFTRALMGALFQVSIRLSKYMSRQMEFDADRYEALLVGSETFRTTARSLRTLNHAIAEVHQCNAAAWHQQRLLRDIPQAVARFASEFDAARRSAIDAEMVGHTVTRYWDSHPPDVERIDRVERSASTGHFRNDAPARLLFAHYERWSGKVTRLFYSDQGVGFTDAHLLPSEQILGLARDVHRQREAVVRFFNGQFQAWPLLRLKVPRIPGQSAIGWQEAIDQLRVRTPDIVRQWRQALQDFERRALLRAAIQLGTDAHVLGASVAKRAGDDLSSELLHLSTMGAPFYRRLDQSFSLYAIRIDHAISSLAAPERGRARSLRRTVNELVQFEAELGLLEELAGALKLLSEVSGAGRAANGFEVLLQAFAECVEKLIERTDGIAQSVTADKSIGAFLRSSCQFPAAGMPLDGETALNLSRSLPQAFRQLYLLALGGLVALCDGAEQKSGIRPLRLTV